MIMPMRQKITAIIPTLNEEKNIEEAIRCLTFADEIIVIDSYSSDHTISICQNHDVKIIQRKFDDFSSQKNYAISQALNNWVFVLDADERIPSELAQEIIETLKNPKDFVAFNVFRIFYFEGCKINYGGWQTDKVIRLFKKDACRYDGKLVHERISYKGNVGFLKHRIAHYSYQSEQQYAGKLAFYASLQAKELMQQQKRVTLMHQMIKPTFRFFVLYVVRFGFLDGNRGYKLSRMHAKGVLQRYINFKALKI